MTPDAASCPVHRVYLYPYRESCTGRNIGSEIRTYGDDGIRIVVIHQPHRFLRAVADLYQPEIP